MIEINSEPEMWDIERVIPYDLNTKLHSATQVRKIANSIASYGWDQPIVVDKDGVIIKGHGRLAAAKHLGLREVPVVVADHLTEGQVKTARIADNKVAESAWDVDRLWDELAHLKEEGVDERDMGFDTRAINSLFPDAGGVLGSSPGAEGTGSSQGGANGDGGEDVSSCGGDNDDGESVKGLLNDKGEIILGDRDQTCPLKDSFISPHKGDTAFLRRMSMVDYLNWHDKIVVGFSSGKDSLAALLWICENCDTSKIEAYYTNPTWGVDWPHSLAFVQVVERRLGIKVHMVGQSDPAAPNKWEHWLMQLGFPGMIHSCWIESHIKIPQANKLMEHLGWTNKSGTKTVQIIACRWAESPNRAKTYPDRGVLKDTKNHYASPVLLWSDADVAKYIAERGFNLHTAYENEGRMGCLMCPKGSPTGAIAIRKKFPKHWANICRWYAMGARRNGKLAMSFQKWLSSTDDDVVKRRGERFTGAFHALALSTTELEDLIEQLNGEPLPERPYLTEPYKKGVHDVPTDLSI